MAMMAVAVDVVAGFRDDRRDGDRGLLATQGIRGGANRRVLERIGESGGIFFARSRRPG